MFCSNCGKELGKNDKYCKYCGYFSAKEAPESTNYIKPQINPPKNNENNIFGWVTIIGIIVVLFCFAFAPIKFEIQIMGTSVEATVSYDFAMQKAKFSVGSFSVDMDNVGPIEYLEIKSKINEHYNDIMEFLDSYK
jgi:hypothetical protein